MRIVHWLTQYPPDLGGLETLVSQLIAEQVRAGHDVTAITSFGVQLTPAFEVHAGAQIHCLPLVRALNVRDLGTWPACGWRSARQVAATSPELHHIHQLSPIAFDAETVITQDKTPCVVTMYSPFSASSDN